MDKLRTTLATLAATALTASLGAAAVAAEDEAPADDQMVGVYSIEGMTWLLTGLLVDGEMVELPDGAIVSLRLEDGDAGGNGGCNSYFTTYTVDGDSISVDPTIGQTMMACPSDEHSEQARAYIVALTNAATWSIDASGNLELRDEGGALQVGYVSAE